jgi:hypothetical protein
MAAFGYSFLHRTGSSRALDDLARRPFRGILMESSLLDDAKREIEAAVAQGFSPSRVELPKTPGCRACSDGPASVTIFAARRDAARMSFRYCFAKVCVPCLAIGEAEEAMDRAIAEEV